MTRRSGLVVSLGLLLGVVAACGEPGDDAVVPEPTVLGPVETVFVGDSITAGVNPTTFAADGVYSWVTYALLDDRTPWEIKLNAALFGRTLAEMQQRFGDEVLSQDPEGVVIMGGTNDVLRQLPVEDSVEALRTMITTAQDEGMEVWVVAPPPLDPSYDRDLGPLVDAEADLAAELDVPYVDVRDELDQPDSNWAPGLSSDGVHPSEEGAKRLADAILDSLVEVSVG